MNDNNFTDMMQEEESSDDGQIKNIKQDELKDIIL